METILPIIGGLCIHIWLQGISPYCHCYIFHPPACWIQECDLFLTLNLSSLCGLKIWKPFSRQLRSKPWDIPHIIICIRSRLFFQSYYNLPEISHIQYAEPVDHKLTDHVCDAQVEGLQEILILQWSGLWDWNIFSHCKNGGTRHMLWMILHQ